MIFRYPTGIQWTVEQWGIYLVDSSDGKAHRLVYPEAALWDLLSRDTNFSRLVELMRAITGMSSDGAAGFIEETLDVWIKAGMLERVEQSPTS